MRIDEIRAKDVHKIVEIVGEISSIGEVEHRIVGGHWECQACGAMIHKMCSVEDDKMNYPERCVCGNRIKKRFSLTSKEFADIRKIKIKEFEEVYGLLLIPLCVWIDETLLDKRKKSINEGDKIKVKGMIILSKNEKNPYVQIANEILDI